MNEVKANTKPIKNVPISKTKDPAKAFFFLRHNNDIDHMVPVIYKWLSTENIPTDVIITTNQNLLQDYRIRYLKKFKNVRIFYINDLFRRYSLPYFFNLIYAKYGARLDNVFNKCSYIRHLAIKIIKKIGNQIFERVNNGIVVFDWTTTFFVQQIVEMAKNRKYTTISLPHGDWPYVNYLITRDDLNYDCLNSYEQSKIFDCLVIPNDSMVKLYEDYLEKDRLKILGSPRYCDEWINIISKLMPSFHVDESEDKLKIIFFLRNTGYPIFWEEVVRTISLILQFPNIYLVVKHHPRNAEAKKITKKLMNIYPGLKQKINKNLKFIYGEGHSGSLIRWADVIIDVGTSTTWEAIKLKKPVIMPEYLHANYSKIAYYIKLSEIKCRDELYDIIQKFIKDKNQEFYIESELDNFIENVIDVPDKQVLERYCKFLKSCFKDLP